MSGNRSMLLATDLKDPVPIISEHLQNGIHFVDDCREFVKERAQIEREYSQRLEALAKKYQNKKNRSPEEDECSAQQAWAIIVNQTEAMAKERGAYANALASRISEKFRVLSAKKTESRNRHMGFAQKLIAERDRVIMDMDKAKTNYWESSEETATNKMRQSKGDGVTDKAKRQYQHDMLDRNNNKNLYVVTIHAANAIKQKYYNHDLPALLEQMKQSNESRIAAMKGIWQEYISMEQLLLNNAQSQVGVISEGVARIDGISDSATLIAPHQLDIAPPPDFLFHTSPIIRDTEDISQDENETVFLFNKMTKLRRQQAEVTTEFVHKTKEVEALRNKLENCKENEFDDLNETYLESWRQMIFLENSKLVYDTQVYFITECVGENMAIQQPHDFKATSFTLPTKCDFCQNNIWGLSNKGFTCRDCDYNCHAKCEMNVPPTCSNVKGGAKASRTLSISSSNSVRAKNRASIQVFSSGSAPTSANVSPNPGASSPNRSPSLQSPSSRTSSASSMRAPPSRALPNRSPPGVPDRTTATVIYDYQSGEAGHLKVVAQDVITIVQEDDGSGWVRAEKQGAQGLVPASYISINPKSGSRSSKQIDQVRALYDYEARSGAEMSIRAGDLIEVVSRDCAEGWWEGRLNGQQGLFPSSYVEKV
ncbi:uncharacterized protein VTP21DRAFT_316 [Calcarisporiella thermophila]|uniref:uncharacterized protein n=1 Tax=Calcarisporiella thermophila TaxID=911321 RepID=UPI003743E238